MHDARERQQQHWEQTYTDMPQMYGEAPSDPALIAAERFREEEVATILELGGGHGRDSLYFARRGFRVTMLDYSRLGVDALVDQARELGLSANVTARQHDVRLQLPFPDASFDACYSHMLFSMAISTAEQTTLAQEVWRVLRPGALHIYTVRHKDDPHFRVGTHHGEDRYETGGFEVHFFDRAKVLSLATGFELLDIDTFEEGSLPRRLFRVTLRKLDDQCGSAAGSHIILPVGESEDDAGVRVRGNPDWPHTYVAPVADTTPVAFSATAR